jgi:DNA invertase Pin-like site-specific DNA recombinase
MSKINQSHLERAAYIYIRQSKPEQVQNNVESRRCQYGLTDRARQLGFGDVHVIDEDLGRSGTGYVDRYGFEALLAAVCQGQVGAVVVIDASRLARNGHEWHRLLEFCGIVDTLIVDHDGVYDPKHPNDRLLLGLKGMMSEMETAAFRQRSQEAIRQMARRGVITPGFLKATCFAVWDAWKKILTSRCGEPWSWCSPSSASWAVPGRSHCGFARSRSQCPGAGLRSRIPWTLFLQPAGGSRGSLRTRHTRVSMRSGARSDASS